MATDPYAFGSFLIPQTPGLGLIYFDCVVSETAIRDAEITEFPVETGANIADHYRVKLTGFKMEVFVSQEPITADARVHPNGGGLYGAQALDFSKHPYPTPGALATIATAVVNPVGLVTNTLSNLISGDERAVTMNSVLQFPNQFDSLTDLLGALDAIRAAAGLVDIATKSFYYDSFAIGPVTTSRDKGTGTGTKVSIEFKRIATVQTQTVGAPPVPQKPKDKPPVNKGAQQPQDPAQMQSLASKAVSLLTGGP